MKPIVRLLAVLGLVLTFSACSKREEEPAPVPPPVESKPVEPEPVTPAEPEVVAVQETLVEKVLEERLAAVDDIDVRAGPGLEHPRMSTKDVVRGAKLYVVEEYGLWLRVRLNPLPGPSVGWVHRFTTLGLATGAEAVEKEIEKLLGIGIVKSIDNEAYQAKVDPVLWLAEDRAVQQGMCRLLAEYTAQKRGSPNPMIDVRNADTGYRLARYSAAMGFRVYGQALTDEDRQQHPK